jgi:hypothetical protein
MDSIFGKLGAVVAVVLTIGVSSLPSCSAMGGGMRHMIEVPSVASPVMQT